MNFAMSIESNTKAGMMTYFIAGKDHIIIDHNEVKPEFKGKNIGRQSCYKTEVLVRERNIKITPLSRYINVMFKKYEDIRDAIR